MSWRSYLSSRKDEPAARIDNLLMHRTRALLVVLMALVAGCTSAEPRRPIASRTVESPAASPSPTELEPSVVRRTLDFTARGRRGETQWLIPYGRTVGTVGFADTCVPPEDCQPPCPCTVPMVPTAFDVDKRGKLWVLDSVVPRVAVFSPDGRSAFEIPLGELGYRSLDLQVVDDRVLVALQDRDFQGRFIEFDLEGSRSGSMPVLYKGGRAGVYGRIDVVDDRMFHAILVGASGDEELFAELVPQAGHIIAREAAGWPLLEQTLEYPPGALDATIPLHVAGPNGWVVDISFEFVMRVGSRRISPPGIVSWGDMEIDHEGAIHLLVFAGTDRRRKNVDGLWYLKVSPEGEVGRMVKLKGPERDDGSQTSRRLTLSHAGEPFVMWTDSDGLRIETMTPLESLSVR